MKPRGNRDTPDPRPKSAPKSSKFSPLVIVGIIVGIVGVVLAFQYAFSSVRPKSPVKTAAPVSKSSSSSELMSMKDWEAEFDSILWSDGNGNSLRDPPFLFTSEGALVKSIRVNGLELRSLVFDYSGEVQGTVAFSSSRPDFRILVLEYIRSMVFGLTFSPAARCQGGGRALVIGLGAGTLANFVRVGLPKWRVEVAEVSTDVLRAARETLGTPKQGESEWNDHDESTGGMKVRLEDGREAVDRAAREGRTYQLVILDAYVPGPRIPEQLEQEDFVSLVSRIVDRSDGCVVLNFCLPFYNVTGQHRVLEPYMKHFAHAHVIEATPTSKVLVAYHGEKKRTREEALKRLEALQKGECKWPKLRGMSYEAYLPKEEGEEVFMKEWLKQRHLQATAALCDNNKMDATYCKWFTPRHKIVQQLPSVSFAGLEMEQAIKDARNDVQKAIALLEQQK